MLIGSLDEANDERLSNFQLASPTLSRHVSRAIESSNPERGLKRSAYRRPQVVSVQVLISCFAGCFGTIQN